MHLNNKDTVNRPVDVVYEFMRDNLPKLAPFLNDIDKIDQVSLERTSDTRVEILNHWYGSVNLPKVLKAIIKPEYLHWKDQAVWHDDDKKAVFHMEHIRGKTMFDADGTLSFTAKDDITELEIDLNLEIYYDRIPGVPKFLAKRIKSTINNVVETQIVPNMNRLVVGLNKYFETQAD